MALYPNGRYLSRVAGRHFGGATAAVGGSGAGFDTVQRGLRGARLNRFAGEEHLANASTPDGYGMQALVPPLTAGSMSAGVSGSGLAGGDGILAMQAIATLIGSGDLTAAGGLIVSLLATIGGSGGVSSAEVSAYLNMLATIGGSGGLTGTPSGLGDMTATLAGDGGAGGSTATGIGNMGATLRGYGDLTPEGIRDAVWNALLAQYQVDGSAGKALSTASSGGVDLVALAASVWTYATRTLTGTAAALTTEQAAQLQELHRIHGLQAAAPLVVTPSSRAAGDIEQSVTEVGETVTVTRAP